jgi:GFO/IDH/MocA oxidoreductase family protein
MQRRNLLKSGVTAAGLTILKSGTLRGQNAPSNKLNVALIGVWGRGTAHYNVLRDENVVALCDVNDLRTKEALQIFPKAKTYWDWRRLLDQKDVEAVIICTADHHHAFIANWALNRDMHVYCEKPLGITVEEQSCNPARDAAPRVSECRTPPRVDSRWRDRRIENGS